MSNGGGFIVVGGGGGGGSSTPTIPVSAFIGRELFCATSAGNVNLGRPIPFDECFCYVKAAYLWNSHWGPPPTTSKFTFLVGQDAETPIAVTAAVSAATLTAPVANVHGAALFVPLVANAQNNLFHCKANVAKIITLYFNIDVIAGNAGSSPAIGIGFELGVISTAL